MPQGFREVPGKAKFLPRKGGRFFPRIAEVGGKNRKKGFLLARKKEVGFFGSEPGFRALVWRCRIRPTWRLYSGGPNCSEFGPRTKVQPCTNGGLVL